MVFSTIEWIIIIVLFLLFFISGIVTTIIIFYKRRWNYSYVVLEKIGGEYIVSRRGKCRLMPFGDGGEEVFYLRDLKKWRVAYGKRIAKNQVLWVIGEDGYWYNSSFNDFDKTLVRVGVMPIDRDMRYAYASVRKGIDNRYDKKNFMDKYGTLIAFGMLFVCILAMIGFLWFASNQQQKIANVNAEGLKTSLAVMELSKEVLANIDNIKTGGSGAVPVTDNTPRPVITPTGTTT